MSENPYQAPESEIEGESPVAGNLSLASPGRRLGAVLLDSVPFIALALVMGLLATRSMTAGASSSSGDVVAIVFPVVIIILMGINIYLLAKYGQTIGKRILNVRIARPSGEKANFWRIVLLRYFVAGLPGAIPMVGWIYSIADPLFIFRKDRRCIHDMIAKTVVVNN